MTEPRGPRTARERWLRAGVALGAAMVIIPFVASVIGIARVSGGPEGLRGATHRPEIKKQVGSALGSTALLALLALPGVLLGVLSGLTLVEDRRKREDERAGLPPDDSESG